MWDYILVMATTYIVPAKSMGAAASASTASAQGTAILWPATTAENCEVLAECSAATMAATFPDLEPAVTLSVVIPLYNEEESLSMLVAQLLGSLRPLGEPFELVLVDDGSSDRTPAMLEELSQSTPELVAVLLRRNYGQTAAMAAGFDASSGNEIVTLDGDLQNDPADIPMVVEKLRQGYDLVSGWRYQRQDNAISRLLPSLLANKLIARVTGVRLHD